MTIHPCNAGPRLWSPVLFAQLQKVPGKREMSGHASKEILQDLLAGIVPERHFFPFSCSRILKVAYLRKE
jgi:hypothetical protein